MTDQLKEYQRRFETFLTSIAKNLQTFIELQLSAETNIDRIVARAKEPSRFAEKAERRDKDGKPKYQKPLTEIQDQLGARVIVFYRDDVTRITNTINRYFRSIEETELVPDSQWKFGYFGQHLILSLPRDVIPVDIAMEEVPAFFELQIKTLFQHAWSEANHDLGYKSKRKLSMDQERRLAFTSAQAWGADHIFAELCSELLA